MNSTTKKAPGARGVQQQTRPVVVQLKNGVSAQRVERPVAPPVYKPQPRSLQPARPRAVPAAPPVYRPQPAHAAAQAKASARPPLANAPKTAPQRPTAPPVYRPQPVPKCLQPKSAVGVAGARPAETRVPVMPRLPAPLSVLQAKSLLARVAAPGPGVIQRMEQKHNWKEYGEKKKKPKKEDKYLKQNTKAASALGVGSKGKEEEDNKGKVNKWNDTRRKDKEEERGKEEKGNKKISLEDLFSDEVAKKLTGYCNKSAVELQMVTAMVPVHINRINAEIKAMLPQLVFDGLGEKEKEVHILDCYHHIINSLTNANYQLREPHVNDAKGLQEDGNMDAVMVGNTDVVKLAWYYYAKNTPSYGWEKMTREKRMHTPQFAEIGLGGLVSRAIYDWHRNKFYLTPHYNTVESKGLDNAYVKLVKGHTWSWEDVKVAEKFTGNEYK